MPLLYGAHFVYLGHIFQNTLGIPFSRQVFFGSTREIKIPAVHFISRSVLSAAVDAGLEKTVFLNVVFTTITCKQKICQIMEIWPGGGGGGNPGKMV